MSNSGDTDEHPAGSLAMAELGDSLPPTSTERAGLVNVLKSLAGPGSGHLESLPKKVRCRVTILQELQAAHDELEAKFNVERAALEAKYAKLYEPLYVKRADIVNGAVEVEAAKDEALDPADPMEEGKEEVKGVPEFWLTAMKTHEILGTQITERDAGALKYIKDIKCSTLDDPVVNKGFKLDFYFDTNPYFVNAVLSKTYHMIDDEEPILEKAVGTEIDWHAGKNITQKVMKKKPKKGSRNTKPVTRTEQCDSFFNFFSPPQVPEDDDVDQEVAVELQYLIEDDFVIGSALRDKIIPHAVSWYTGAASEGEYLKSDEEDDYGEDGDEDEDDDEDEEDEDEDVPGRKEGVVKADYVWGANVGINFKSVTLDGEPFSLGDCVRCPLKSKPGHIGKIVKLFEKEGKKMCRIRSFYSPADFPIYLKGFDFSPEPKELFLASGEGLGVERDMLLGKIAGRCIVLCTADEGFNVMPSREQVEAADHFFRRAYDPAAKEVGGLDIVEEAIGAQKVFNKKEWLVQVVKTVARSSPQESASRIHRLSPAVSGSSSRQDAAKVMSASLSEVSPAPSGDLEKRKLKKRKSDDLVPEHPEADDVKKTNLEHMRRKDTNAVSTGKRDSYSEHLVLAIPAPARMNPSLKVAPAMKGKPPTTSTPNAKALKSVGKGEPMSKPKVTEPGVKSESPRVLSSSISPVGSKQNTGYEEGAVSGMKKRKPQTMLGTEGPPKKILKPSERSKISGEREKPFNLQKRGDEGIARANTPTAEQKPGKPIFKRKQDWDVASLIPAIQNNRVLLLENLTAGLHSDDLSEALTHLFKFRCDVRIVPPESSSFRTTSALLKLPSASLASRMNDSMNSRNIFVSGRLVTTSFFKYSDFKAKASTSIGHIEFPKEGRDYINEDYRDAVATSHLAQGNTIEFDYGLPWRVLDDQHEEQWRMLQEEFNSSNPTVSKKVA